jgi:hypothetical protein
VPDGRTLLALEITSGRGFTGGDGPQSCRVALVNRATADAYFAGDAVGRSMRDAGGRRVDIVGVVSAKSARANDDPLVYLFSRQTGDATSADEVPQRYQLHATGRFGPPADLDLNIVSPEYFAAVGAPIADGQGFEGVPADGCATAIVNREAAQEYFGGAAVGGALVQPDGQRIEITGIADTGPLRVMQPRTGPMAYLPWGQRYVPRMTLIAVTPFATRERIADITGRLTDVPGGKAPPRVATLEEHLARTALGPERIAAVLIACATIVALALGLLGVYGVMSDTVRQRKREIALRLALGARAGGIVAGILADGLRIAALGGAAGLAAAWIAVRLVVYAHPDFRAPALWMWMACPAVVALLVAIAVIAPARWALAVDPMTITREG